MLQQDQRRLTTARREAQKKFVILVRIAFTTTDDGE
jgi:hypothetical protein